MRGQISLKYSEVVFSTFFLLMLEDFSQEDDKKLLFHYLHQIKVTIYVEAVITQLD